MQSRIPILTKIVLIMLELRKHEVIHIEGNSRLRIKMNYEERKEGTKKERNDERKNTGIPVNLKKGKLVENNTPCRLFQ